ncbi:pyridoxamine 5'-phosphate oxidase family protein [Halobacillus salinarum]|uniref:Pyridoxamine 5'-phosphate oxidase family protein n=1 Tax=Halobacillus salinarum TaxID=2932257 RepID=A0ABY4EKL8_9BACI|nr:pyridoxamine 5'-phosphate oxidase family protein [Halobacillus salinarum]UOQ44403.1 pyridoxamine 5'-phosphate oxidase family protein [Halobacillus salinarum]
MDQQELKKKVYNILDQHTVGTLATVRNNKPYSRFMTFSNDDEFTFYAPTHADTHKTEEIEENPNVHILIGYEGHGFGDSYLEVEGQAKIRDDQKIKDWLWSEDMERWFTSKQDNDYIVLEIYPESIRLMNAEGNTPATLEM